MTENTHIPASPFLPHTGDGNVAVVTAHPAVLVEPPYSS